MSARSVLAVIPARAGSTRFPGKPLARLWGRPLVQHVWARASASPAVGRVVVATDDDAIEAAVRGFGGEVVRTRADHASGTDRVAEVAARPEFAAYRVVANVQGDEPLLDPGALAAAVVPVAAGEARLATLAHREHDAAAFASPDVVKVVVDAAGDALYFSRAPIGGDRDAGGAPPAAGFLRHVGLYVFDRATLAWFAATPASPLERAERLEQLRALEHGIRIRVVVTPWMGRGVDTPQDLAALERDRDAAAAPAPDRPTEMFP